MMIVLFITVINDFLVDGVVEISITKIIALEYSTKCQRKTLHDTVDNGLVCSFESIVR
jgi:hypothetical protein